ncbi:MAG: hypothetical protein HYY12_04275 [Candidatus Methylomirabilis oxyfera]|nr:hypothetical protein [Candidatus Methylomirabilis oxyfera]
MNRTIRGYSASALLLSAAIIVLAPSAGWGHGVVGKRFFPTTLAIEDPFVSDELSFVVGHIKGPEGKETELEVEIQKRLSPNFSLGFGGAYKIIKPSGGHGGEEGEHEESTGTAYGFSNPTVSLRYQFLRDTVHELAGTLALNITPGGVGARRVESLSETTLTPALQIGKGFGDLPDAAAWLKPFAVTSSLGFNIFTGHSHTEELDNNLEWGVTLMYSIPYLQSFVKDVGIPWPFSRLIPIVEFNGETLLTGHGSGDTTAFANPGLIWAGKYIQLAVEAKIPLNDISGHHVGILGMIHFFLDDIAPDIFTWTAFHGVLGPTQR